jgi:hypothetical protein
VANRARPVLDDELLAKPFRQPLPHQACSYVGATARSKADDHAHRPGRIGLRPCHARDGRQRGSAGGQMQKLSAGKFHGVPGGLSGNCAAAHFSRRVICEAWLTPTRPR